MHSGDAPYNHIVASGYQALQVPVSDFGWNLFDGLLVRFSGTWPAAGRSVVAEFLDGNAGAKDPALRIERGLGSLVKGRGVFHLNRDGVAFLQGNGGRLLQNG